MDQLDTFSSLPEAFFEMAKTSPDREVYRQAVIDPQHDAPSVRRQRKVVTYRETQRAVKACAAFLRQCGVRRGDRVVIIAQSRPEWMEADLATLTVGGVVVAVYPSLIREEVGFLLFDSGARVVIAENQEQVDKLAWLLEHDCPVPATEERAATTARVVIEKIVAIESAELPPELKYVSHGNPRLVPWGEVLQCPFDEAVTLYESIRRDDLASLVYTSGTTGAPKGVMQTHGNHLANIRQARESGLFNNDSRLSVFLPLAHSFAKLMAYIGFLTPAYIEFPAVSHRDSSKVDPAYVTRDLREGSADIVPAVPRIFEKMEEGIRGRAHKGGIGGLLVRVTLWAAEECYRAKKGGGTPSMLAAVVHGGTGVIREKIKRALFGSNFRYAISGGAKLQPATNEFFDGLNIQLLEGYGLTETVVATNINRPERRKIGTVGPVLASDIYLRIAEDGEICFKGPNVAVGYYNRPAATKQSWDVDGWFHTGDLGAVDGDGFLSITGRKKELIVTSGGKKIAPDPIEQRLKSNKFVSQVMMFGDERPFAVALVCLNMNALEIWAKQRGKQVDRSLADDPDLHREVWLHVEEVNQSLASFETIKRIKLLLEEFTLENGLLTPTLKVKRREVVKRYRDALEKLYEA